MRLLAWVDDRRWSNLALQYACRELRPEDEVVLLAVCPRGGEAYLECGRMVVEAAVQACAGTLADARVRTRIDVGDPCELIRIVASEERADVLVMGAGDLAAQHGGAEGVRPMGAHCQARGTPLAGSRLSFDKTVEAVWRRGHWPVLVGTQRGVVLLAGGECLLICETPEAPPPQVTMHPRRATCLGREVER